MPDNDSPENLEARAFEIYQTALELNDDELQDYILKAVDGNEMLSNSVYALLDSAKEADQLGFMQTAIADVKNMGLTKDKSITDKPTILPPPIGNYKPIKLLGEGGFGQVFLAEQTDPVIRRVAIKLIRAELCDDRFIKRFEAEWQMLAVLNHPNIAQIYDAGAGEEDRPYLVMEYVQGSNIIDYCNQKQLGIDQRLSLFLNVCSAIQHAHQKGVIHRDIKPANVLVAERDGQAIPKVIDFGIAKSLDIKVSEYTIAASEFFGSPSYMSPEQIEQTELDIDTRSDVYGLGILLYELLVGVPPFVNEDSLISLMNDILSQEPMRPSNKVKQIPTDQLVNLGNKNLSTISKALVGDLDWIIIKALEKSRDDRYASASAFSADINRYLINEPVSARAPSVVYRTRKFIHRHTLGVITSMAIFVLLIAGIIGTSSGYINAKKESTRAKLAEASAQHQAETAQQTVALLMEFLSAADPGNEGRDLRVVELLEAFKPRLEDHNQLPIVRASLLFTYAKTYFGLGLFPEAVQFADRAVMMRESVLGKGHPETIEAMNFKVNTLREMGKYNEASQWGKRTIIQASEKLGEEHPLTLQAASATADVLKELGHYAEAESMHRETLEKRQRILGNEHLDTIHSMARLAVALGYQDKINEAVELNRKVLAARKRLLGNEHPTTLNTMNNLAFALAESGDLVSGEALHRQTLDMRKQVLGNEHPETLTSMANLAWTLNAQGKYAQAEKMSRLALAIEQEVLGGDHPDALVTMGNIANSMMKLGRLDEAVNLHKEVWEKRKKVFGEEHPATQASINDLAVVYLFQGENAKAKILLIELLKFRQRSLGDEHAATLKTAEMLEKLNRKPTTNTN